MQSLRMRITHGVTLVFCQPNVAVSKWELVCVGVGAGADIIWCRIP